MAQAAIYISNCHLQIESAWLFLALGKTLLSSFTPCSNIPRWAGFVLSRELDSKKFQTVVVSPRSYFVFTPLLASTAVGTLEFRTTLESVRARRTDVEFIQGWGNDVNFNEQRLQIEESTMHEYLLTTNRAGDGTAVDQKGASKGKLFNLDYDKLVVAVGCYSQTFNTPGVRENALFLKDVSDAIKIRKRILDCMLCTTSFLCIFAND